MNLRHPLKLGWLLVLIGISTLTSFCQNRPTSDFSTADVDIKFYHLDLNVRIDKPYFSGNALLRFCPKKPTHTVVLKLEKSLLVRDVFCSNPLSFRRKDDWIILSFKNLISDSEIQTVKIYYEGKPAQATDGTVKKGLIYETHHNQEPVIATLSTPFLAHYWYPTNDDLSDKADSAYVSITIPDTLVQGVPLSVVSNGNLKHKVKRLNNQVTFRWQHRYPIAPCYIFFAISNYVQIEDKLDLEPAAISLPLRFYAFPSDRHAAEMMMQRLKKVLKFYIATFGDYPFRGEPYGIAQIGFYNGIETQTCPIVKDFSPDRWYTLIHEMAHLWFGNSLTAYSWEEAWLHEGFATYAEALWEETENGKRGYVRSMEEKMYFHQGVLQQPPTDNPYEVFTGVVYNKGAWVLHQLRGVVGEAAFFRILKDYVQDFQFQNVRTQDFQAVCEEVSGKDLGFFFEQWVQKEGYPIYAYHFFQNPKNNQLQIQLFQNQNFIMPIQFLIKMEYKDTLVTVWNDRNKQEWNFDLEQRIKDVELDPYNWVLKEVQLKKKIKTFTNVGVYNVEFSGSLSGRTVSIVTESGKAQKVEFRLETPDHKAVYSKNFKIGGTTTLTVEIPRNVAGGLYNVVVESKSESYSRKWIVVN